MKKPSRVNEVKTPTEAVSSALMSAKAHTELFASAMKSFSSGDYSKALPLFERAAAGPVLSVNESASMYRRMCEQRLTKETEQPKSAEENYVYGITLLNAGRYKEAASHFEKAASDGSQPHYLYALALAEGLQGSIDSAADRLRRAIEIDPKLRSQARSDSDFQPLMHHPQIRELLAGAGS